MDDVLSEINFNNNFIMISTLHTLGTHALKYKNIIHNKNLNQRYIVVQFFAHIHSWSFAEGRGHFSPGCRLDFFMYNRGI